MTGLEYIGRRDLHPFWDECRDPNREDVADAYEQGKIDGYNEVVDLACTLYEQDLKMAVNLLNRLNHGAGDIIDIEKSVYKFKKALQK